MSAIAAALPRRRLRLSLLAAVGLIAILAFALGGWLLWRSRPLAAPRYVEYPMQARTDIPAAVAVAPTGEVWFTIDFSNAIGLLGGETVRRFSKPRENLDPLGLAVAPDGSAWFTDAIDGSIGHVFQDGSIEAFPAPTRIVRFGRLAIAPDGAVWYADGVISGFTRLKDGVFTAYTVPSADPSPFGVAVDPAGNVWGTLQTANQLVRIGTDGRIELFELPTRAAGPTDLAIGPDGAVWFIELRANRIGRYADGQFTDFAIPTPNAGPVSLAVAPDGAVWFTELTAHRLGRIRNGQVAELPLPRQDARPFGIAVDRFGNVWYTDLQGWLGKLPAEEAQQR